MQKKTTLAFASLLTCTAAMAGGLNTNTNQNAAFLRQLSQEAIIDITGLYMNPAGTAFLASGHHFSLNIQNARQTRDISTTMPLFQLNDGNIVHDFQGKAYAPVIPSFQYSYNSDGKWSFNVNFAIGGGGGECEFANGLGSFEALYAGQLVNLVPAAVKAQLPGMVAQGLMDKGLPQEAAKQIASMGTYNAQLTGYSLDAYMKGKQYVFGLTLGADYKIMDNLALYAGLRGVYATNNYNGYVKDIKAQYAYSYEVAVPALGASIADQGTGSQSLDANALTLNADQSGFGLTPILGIDWRINDRWNLAAKYEFKTRLRLENSTEMNDFGKATAATNSTLGQFQDGAKIAADIPSFLALGAQYSPSKCVRLQAGFHWYGDKLATQYGNKQDLIDDNTWEVTAGAEWDVCRWVTLSCGYQTTQFGLSDEYMNDLSFTTSSYSLGFGARVHICDCFNIDLGYMNTQYDERTVDTKAAPTGPIIKSDNYDRTNRVFGIGLNYCF